ncbi:MAG: heme-binding protein [Chloroflexota bacterium]|nr:heme-binding protein [Chloroflexota bacterium]MDE2885237.1 heme-binding protein [Chloroflexota bacterium]
MYDRQVMDVEDALRAVDAAMEAASVEGAGPVAVAVVDDNGDLVAFARADGTPIFQRRHAIRKAYTASRVGADLTAFSAERAQRGMSAAEFDDAFVGAAHGGVVVRAAGQGAVVGAVGVQGFDREQDERLARVALAALEGGLA